ncbi:L,D-transpeptidase family protein [Gramella jeungdoensis]|nr:L,D-transpeptidase family protein [Gramella jeungdoensis]
MRAPVLISCLFYLILLSGCKNEKKAPGIEERNEVEEITSITKPGRIEDFFDEDKAEPELYNLSAVASFYKENDYSPVWNQRELREDLYRNIENIENEGLFFEDYHGDILQELLSSLDTNSKKENTFLEILLTDAFLKLSEDLATGKLNPKDLYEIWGTPLNEIDSKELLKKAISEGDIQKALDSVRPKHIVYHDLKKALKKFKRAGIEEDSITKIPDGKLIRPGESDARIELVAKRLAELGYFKENVDSTNTNYNLKLQDAVKAFQQDHGLQVDALLGSTTIKNLNLTRRDRYHQILVNLERWRWYPRDLGEHYIIINIPHYKLSVVKNGDTIRSHRTMVGTQVRKTPVFSDEVGYIVYNPTWTIPPTIKKNDVIPGMRRDANYLRKKGLRVFDSDGNLVDPSTVDWSSSKPLSYTYRQQPGASNPLGVVKIIYPNEYMIYLHDTPSKDLFQKNARAQSSGCVRVQDALDLAKYLLSDQEKYDDEKIEEIIKSGKITEIPVTQVVKVHHFYWTVINEKDTTKFIDDIYNLDNKLWEQLKPAG